MTNVLKTKSNYRAKEFSTGVLILMLAVDQVIRRGGIKGWPEEAVITSGSDGKHADGSAHYRGDGFDVRSRTFKMRHSEFLQHVIGEAVRLTAMLKMGRALQDGPTFGEYLYQPSAMSIYDDGTKVSAGEYFGQYEGDHFHFQVRKGRVVEID